VAQNGLPTGGQRPVAGGANGGGGAGGMVVLPSTATGSTCMPIIRITTTTGIGITKQIAAEGDYLTADQ